MLEKNAQTRTREVVCIVCVRKKCTHYFSYIVAFSFIGGGMLEGGNCGGILEGGNLGFNNNLYHYRTVNFNDTYI